MGDGPDCQQELGGAGSVKCDFWGDFQGSRLSNRLEPNVRPTFAPWG